MYEISHVSLHEDSKEGRLWQARKEKSHTKKPYSPERVDRQNMSFIGSNEQHNEDYLRGNESKSMKSKLQRIFDPLDSKINNHDIDPNKSLFAHKEPAHYSEFATKLDYLVGKITDLTKSSEDILVKNSEENKFSTVLRDKPLHTVNPSRTLTRKYPHSESIINEKTAKTLDDNRTIVEDFFNDQECSAFGRNFNHKVEDVIPIHSNKHEGKELDPQYFIYRKDNKHDRIPEEIPPILNNNIKYISVHSENITKPEKNTESLNKNLHLLKHCEKQTSADEISNLEKYSHRFVQSSSIDAISESLKLTSYTKSIDTMTDTMNKRIQILISGHLTMRETPVFIIHKNYVRSNVLIKDPLDFWTRKKEGNVDISLTGKFFHENILVENDNGFPSALDLKSHKLLIDSESTVTQEKFKHVIHLELFDAILEGEFVENRDTFQYIPIFNLDVIKHRPDVKINSDKASASIGNNEKLFKNISCDKAKEFITNQQDNTGQLHSPEEDEHLHQSSDKQDTGNNVVDESMTKKVKKTSVNAKENKFTKFKSKFFKLFFKGKESKCNDVQYPKSSQNDSGSHTTKKTEKEIKTTNDKINKKETFSGRNKEKESRREESHKPNHTAVLEIREMSSGSDCCPSPGEKTLGIKDKRVEKKPVRKRQRKRSKIVDNPGVSQIQGFFFQT